MPASTPIAIDAPRGCAANPTVPPHSRQPSPAAGLPPPLTWTTTHDASTPYPARRRAAHRRFGAGAGRNRRRPTHAHRPRCD
ncbi:MAG: alpha/beta hydrolase [Luteimonas sp.]